MIEGPSRCDDRGNNDYTARTARTTSADIAEDPAETVLTKAKDIVTGSRRGSYGDPEDSFSRIATLWDAYLAARGFFVEINQVDVALMMDMVKTARLIERPDHEDSWVDKAGYAACGCRCAACRCAAKGQAV